MFIKSLKQALYTLGITVGVIAVTASQVSAGSQPQHAEPTLKRP